MQFFFLETLYITHFRWQRNDLLLVNIGQKNRQIVSSLKNINYSSKKFTMLSFMYIRGGQTTARGLHVAHQSILCGPWARRRSSKQLLICWSFMDLCLKHHFRALKKALLPNFCNYFVPHTSVKSFFLSENKQVKEQVDANWLQFECTHANHNQ